NRESAAFSEAATLRADRVAMHLNELLDQREPNAETPARAMGMAVDLGEELEDLRQRFPGYSDVIVRDRNHGYPLIAPRRYDDSAAVRRIFGCVVQKVGDDLRHAREVGVEPYRPALQLDFEIVPAARDQWVAGFNGRRQ